MDEMFFVLMTIFALKAAPATDLEPQVRVGDVLEATLLGGSVKYSDCKKGADLLAKPVQQAGGDAVHVHVDCVKLPVEVGLSQGFQDTSSLPLKRQD